MSRRLFIKWIVTMFLGFIGGAGAWLRWWDKPKPEAGPLQADTNTPSPSATSAASTASPSPTPAPTPREKGELLLSFFLFSDMHITMDESTTADKLKLALADVTSFDSKVEAIVFGGDLTDFGRDGDYELLSSTLKKYKLPPLYGNMGNHDYYDIWLTQKGGAFSTATAPNGKTDAQSRSRFMQFIGYKEKPYFDTHINGIHVIMVSQEAYQQERPEVGEGAWYSDEQLNWLKKALEEHKDGKPALIMIHQPLPSIGQNGGSHQLIRAEEFRSILKPYKNVFLFSGHTHRDLNEVTGHYNKESFHWFVNASVGRTRGTSSTTAQGMYIQVFENEVVVRGREFSDRTWIKTADWRIPLEQVKA